MILNIQDPNRATSVSLHESLIEACSDSISGGGIFAFITTGGIHLFLEDKAFNNFLSQGQYNLIVGIDEITNLNSLNKLQEISKNNKNLSVSAFLHQQKGSTFHPKFCWFKKRSGGTLIVGSGNLTVRGLRDNWEAFSIINLSEVEISEIENYWTEWINDSSRLIKSLSDDNVRTRAEQNIRLKTRRIIDKEIIFPETDISPQEKTDEHIEDISPWQINEDNIVLIAEIPKGGNRWNQANFDQNSFEGFFGGKRWDNSYRILLRHVKENGEIGEIENRQAVSVQSHNWRFELSAAAGLNYPSNGRPISIFIKTGVRLFLYSLIMPSSKFYNDVSQFLSNKWSGSPNRMRRIQIPIEELYENLPELNYWN